MSVTATARVLALLLVGAQGTLAQGALAQGTLAQSGGAPDPAQAAREQECGAKADENAMQGAMRESFMIQCIAGEKVSEPKAGDKPK